MMKISSIIKYEGDNKTFIWKHPVEDFNTSSQLIVHESQEALFFANGQALDLFGPGRYTLETQNIPLIGKLLNLPTGGETPFHCEVYFINKIEQMAIKWGTDNKVQFIEPTLNFPLEIGASGQMSITPENSRKLLLKLVGTESLLDQEKLTNYFRSFLMTRVKTYLAQTIKAQKINIFEIDEHLTNLSNALKEKIAIDFLDYGVSLKTFFITTIVKPDGDPQYENFKELHFRQYADIKDAEIRQLVGIIDQQAEAKKMIIEAEGIAGKRNIEGYTYQQERSFDVAEKVAGNEGVGEFSNMGIGLGVMAGVGGNVGGNVGAMVNNAMDSAANAKPVTNDFCASCGAKILPGSAFCDECGNKIEVITKALSTCKSCGYKFEKQSKFCPKCGMKVEV